jgi:hypothetical protein
VTSVTGGRQVSDQQGKPIAFFEHWASITAGASLVFFSALFLFQLGFFQYIGFGFLGLIGASELLINTTLIIPPIVGIIVGLVMGIDKFGEFVDNLVHLAQFRIVRVTAFIAYLAVCIYYIFTDVMMGLFVVPSFTVAIFVSLVMVYEWRHTRTITHHRIAALVVLLGLGLLTTGWVSARNLVCCSTELYTIKTKSGVLEGAKILRSSQSGIIYSLDKEIAFLSKDEIIQVTRAARPTGKATSPPPPAPKEIQPAPSTPKSSPEK